MNWTQRKALILSFLMIGSVIGLILGKGGLSILCLSAISITVLIGLILFSDISSQD